MNPGTPQEFMMYGSVLQLVINGVTIDITTTEPTKVDSEYLEGGCFGLHSMSRVGSAHSTRASICDRQQRHQHDHHRHHSETPSSPISASSTLPQILQAAPS